MLNCLGPSHITLQCDPEPSLIKLADSVKNPNVKSEHSPRVHPDHHIRATVQSEPVRNSCRDRCAQCWQHFKTARNTDQEQ